MDFLKSSLDPMRYNTMPPALFPMTTFSKRFDFAGNFTVTSLNNTYEQVPTSSGAIVWLPSRGLGTLYRFGIVPKSSTTTPSTAAAQGWTGKFPGPYCLNLLYGSPLPLPYNGRVASDVITISPLLQEGTIGQARLYAGTVKLICDTLPVGITALNGYLTAGAIPDIRDVFQSGVQGNSAGTLLALDPVTLVQAAANFKDSIKESPIQLGVTAVIGPDISPTIDVPDRNSIYDRRGTIIGTYNINAVKPPAVPTGNYPNQEFVLWAGWISPYDISATPATVATVTYPVFTGTFQNLTSTNGLRGASNNLLINPIGGCFEITFNFVFSPALLTNTLSHAPTQPSLVEGCYVVFNHVFASVSSDTSAVYYNMVNEIKLVTNDSGAPLAYTNTDYLTTPVSNANGVYIGGAYVVTSSPKRFMTFGFNAFNTNNMNPANPGASPQVGGMYIGTAASILVDSISGTDYIVPSGFSLQPGYISGPYASNPPTVTVCAIDDYAPGELGPCRVLRWDGLVGQGGGPLAGALVRVDGVLMAECIAGVQAAPFVAMAGTAQRACISSSALPFLQQCYNSDNTVFRRIWVSRDFDEYVRYELPCYNTTALRKNSTARLLASAAACGILKEPTLEEIEDASCPRGEKRAREGMEDMVEHAVAKRAASLVNASQAGRMSTSDRLKQMDLLMQPIARLTDSMASYPPS